MTDIVTQYYYYLNTFARVLTLPISNLADQINIPLVSALLFGLIGATSPCQLSTNVAALAFVSRKAAQPRQVWSQSLAYLAGKVTVYLLVGGAIVLFGLQVSRVTPAGIQVTLVTRRVIGPLLILVGLFMLGVLKSRFSLGNRLSAWVQDRVGERRGLLPSYLLGMGFSLAFCPTLFWLFFGLTIPLALSSEGGVLFPGVFAAGATLPLLFFAGFIASGVANVGQLVRRVKRFDFWVQRIVGGIFILVGVNETFIYWFL